MKKYQMWALGELACIALASAIGLISFLVLDAFSSFYILNGVVGFLAMIASTWVLLVWFHVDTPLEDKFFDQDGDC